LPSHLLPVPHLLDSKFCSGGRPFQCRVNALGEEEDPEYDAELSMMLFKCQKEAHGIVDTWTPSHDNLAARIHQVFGTTNPEPKPKVEPVPLHPNFLSPDFVSGQPPDFPQG
jgi:hypothetical protein